MDFFKTKVVKDTGLARRLYPDAESINGYLTVKTPCSAYEEWCYNCRFDGNLVNKYKEEDFSQDIWEECVKASRIKSKME